jgi:hypothetical protein
MPTCCRPRATTSSARCIPRAAAIQSFLLAAARGGTTPAVDIAHASAPALSADTAQRPRCAARPRATIASGTPAVGKAGAEPPRRLAKTHAMTSTALRRTSRASRLATTPSGHQGAPDTSPTSGARRQDAVIRSVFELPGSAPPAILSDCWNALSLATTSRVRPTTGVKLRGPEGAQRLRATSASTSELYRARSVVRLMAQRALSPYSGSPVLPRPLDQICTWQVAPVRVYPPSHQPRSTERPRA